MHEKWKILRVVFNVDIINISLSVNGRLYIHQIDEVIESLNSQGKIIVVSVENGKETSVPVLDDNGNELYAYSLRYSEFIALNTHMLQKAYKKIDRLEKDIAELKKKLG